MPGSLYVRLCRVSVWRLWSDRYSHS
jgi:hypothetical protein